MVRVFFSQSQTVTKQNQSRRNFFCLHSLENGSKWYYKGCWRMCVQLVQQEILESLQAADGNSARSFSGGPSCTLSKFQGDPARAFMSPKQWLFEAIFWLMLWHYRERYFGYSEELTGGPWWFNGIPPSPTKETACKPAWRKPWKCDAIFWLCCKSGTPVGLRWTVSCVSWTSDMAYSL